MATNAFMEQAACLPAHNVESGGWPFSVVIVKEDGILAGSARD
jgi:hypothetical protein